MRDTTTVRCSAPGCEEQATHKIAAPWSDGRFLELKTYGFACPEHLPDVCREAERRWLDYEPVTGEAVGGIGIYRYQEGRGDSRLERDREMEALFLTCPPPGET